MEERDDLFYRERVQDAISHICNYFDEQGLTLYERWHVCRSIEAAAKGIIGAHVDDLLDSAEEHGEDA